MKTRRRPPAAAARPLFQGYQFLQRGPLYVADSTLERLAQEAEALEKAQGRERRLSTKVGALFNLWYGLWSNLVQWGAADKPRFTPTHRFLRQVSERSFIDALILNRRRYQMRHLARRVVVDGQKGWNVQHRYAADPNFRVTKDVERRCDEMEAFLEEKVNRQVHPAGLRDLFVKAVDGQLVLDRVALVKPTGLDGRPRSFHLIPPDDVKPRFEVLLEAMRQDPMRYRSEADVITTVWERERVDLSDKAYVQVLDDGRIGGAWTADEMSVLITNPSDEINRHGYGRSPLEISLEGTTLLMMALNYNRAQFTANFPEAMLVINGEVDPTGLEAFKRQMYAEVGPQGNTRLPVIATGSGELNKAQLLKLRDSLRDMSFVQLVMVFISLKAAAYALHPSSLNFAPYAGGQRPVIAHEDQETQIALAQEEGLHSILESLAEWLTRELIHPYYDDLELVWTVQDRASEQERIELWAKKLEMGATVDEWRATEGLPPLDEATDGQADGKYVNSPFFFQQQARQQEAMMAAATPAGAGPPEDDAGYRGMAPPGELPAAPTRPPGPAPGWGKSLTLVLEDD